MTTDFNNYSTMAMRNSPMNIKETHPQAANRLRAAAIRRNAKTALFLGLASSGAIVSAPALAVTVVGSFTGLYIWGLAKGNANPHNIR